MEPTPTPEAAAGAAIARARRRKGLSARALASMLGIDHSEVCRIEKGRVTSLSRYNEIARALGCEVIFRLKKVA